VEFIGEHLVESSLLSPGGWILDVGSRDGELSQHFAANGFKVLALDPDPTLPALAGPNIFFEQVALVPSRCGSPVDFAHCTTEILSSHVLGLGINLNTDIIYMKVPAASMDALMAKYNIGIFEFAKFDCEGCECVLAEQGAFAKQITVEFHPHLGQSQEQIDSIVSHLKEVGYRIHGSGGMDTLFVLESL